MKESYLYHPPPHSLIIFRKEGMRKSTMYTFRKISNHEYKNIYLFFIQVLEVWKTVDKEKLKKDLKVFMFIRKLRLLTVHKLFS